MPRREPKQWLLSLLCQFLALLSFSGGSFADNRFFIQTARLNLGSGEQTIVIGCDNDQPLLAFSISMRFDPVVMKVTRIALGQDAPTNGWSPPDSSIGQYVKNDIGELTYAAIFGMTPGGFDPTQRIEPGTNRQLVRITVSPLPESATRTRLEFIDHQSSPYWRNAMTGEDGMSTAAPELGLEDRHVWLVGEKDILAWQVYLNDRLDGSLAAPGQEDWYAIGAIEDTLLHVQLRPAGGSRDASVYLLRLYRSSGEEIPIAPQVTAAGLKVKAIALSHPEYHYLRVTTPGGGGGPYELGFKGKLPDAPELQLRGVVEITGTEPTVGRMFRAIPGSLFHATVKGKGAAVDPEIVYLEDPWGRSILGDYPRNFFPATRVDRIRNLPLSDLGTFTLGLSARTDGAVQGRLTLTGKVQPPRRRTVSDLQALPLVLVPFQPGP